MALSGFCGRNEHPFKPCFDPENPPQEDDDYPTCAGGPNSCTCTCHYDLEPGSQLFQAALALGLHVVWRETTPDVVLGEGNTDERHR